MIPLSIDDHKHFPIRITGMSVGGQLPASLVYTVEMKDRKHWGYYGSLVMAAANIGTLLGNLVGAFLRTVLTNEQLYSWGWRIPFLSGIVIAFVALFLKIYGEEHHPNEGEYDQEESQESLGQSKHPLREALRKENRPALISATLTPMLWGAGFYVSFVWMAIFMQDLLDPAIPNAFWINALAMLFGVTIPLPFTGMLSDYCGRMKTMVVGAVGVGVLGPFCLFVITQGQPVRAFFAQWFVGIMLAFYGGPISAWLVERFPVKGKLYATVSLFCLYKLSRDSPIFYHHCSKSNELIPRIRHSALHGFSVQSSSGNLFGSTCESSRAWCHLYFICDVGVGGNVYVNENPPRW